MADTRTMLLAVAEKAKIKDKTEFILAHPGLKDHPEILEWAYSQKEAVVTGEEKLSWMRENAPRTYMVWVFAYLSSKLKEFALTEAEMPLMVLAKVVAVSAFDAYFREFTSTEEFIDGLETEIPSIVHMAKEYWLFPANEEQKKWLQGYIEAPETIRQIKAARARPEASGSSEEPTQEDDE